MTKHTATPATEGAALKLVTHRTQARFGWQPDLPDHRDEFFSAPPPPAAGLPNSVDLRPGCPPVYDQGDLGSCTANAIGGAIEFDRKKEKLTDFVPSRLFIYYNERVMEGTVGSDSGAQIRDGIKSVAKIGAPPEKDWPYDIAQFTTKPPAKAYTDAKHDRAIRYQRLVSTLQQLQGCLASGYPFVFGFTVYESFMTQAVAQSGIMPMPKPGEKKVGGHAVMAVGYDNTTRMTIIRNSWGTGWGQSGYFSMPYEFITSPNCSDFWTIRSVG
ncbi:MAG TPA: C1 family peptidase [Roseiarcus sp.]|nr:C1 family peptidase [Roseiarcus sp.]